MCQEDEKINSRYMKVIVMTHWPVSGACLWYQSTATRN